MSERCEWGRNHGRWISHDDLGEILNALDWVSMGGEGEPEATRKEAHRLRELIIDFTMRPEDMKRNSEETAVWLDEHGEEKQQLIMRKTDWAKFDAIIPEEFVRAAGWEMQPADPDCSYQGWEMAMGFDNEQEV